MLIPEFNEFGFFEGTEKLLEIWFDTISDHDDGDLRYIPRDELDAMLKYVDAEIVSVKQNASIDSYVLSESSMFISKERFIIKTCGIIKLLDLVECVINLAQKYTNLSIVQNFFYSRRAFIRPQEQQGIHQSFEKEVVFLRKIIPSGCAYVFGESGSNEWYLFTMDNVSSGPKIHDATLEILMSNLDDETMRQFTKMKHFDSDALVQSSGIGEIMPGSMYDGFIFDPIGFSLNGLFEDYYYTIHVTPQPVCSYVSFETNLPMQDYSMLISRVLAIFKPGRFIETLFVHKGAPCRSAAVALGSITGYVCDDRQCQQLKNYSLAYKRYVKNTYI